MTSRDTAKRRIIAFPKRGVTYNECFYRALEDEHIETLEGVFGGRWILGHVQRGDFVHIHWPSFLYSAPDRRRLTLLHKFARFLLLLALIKTRGASVLWTAHNLLPHERSRIPVLDVLARRIVIALSHRIFAHGLSGAAVLRRRFPTVSDKVITIDHGNWIDLYPSHISRAEARSRLLLTDDAYVYLFIGGCKEYKNLDLLVDVFRTIEGKARLIVAGEFPKEAYHRAIAERARADERIEIHAGFIPTDEVQVYLLACDSVVLPYRDVLTSGTAMLAMSFGRPVVSVDSGYLKDVVPRDAGVLYDPNSADGLRDAMTAVRERSFDEHWILTHAKRFDWADTARTFARALAV